MRKLSFAAFALMILACSSHQCDLVSQLKARAGNGAVDCGYAVLGGDPSSVDTCVLNSFAAQSPFFARYDRQGIDSKVIFGMAWSGQGDATFLLWDGDPSGGSAADPVISGTACIAPAVDATPNRDSYMTPPLMCASSTSLGYTCG